MTGKNKRKRRPGPTWEKPERSRPFSKLSDYRAFIGSAKQNFDARKQRQACAGKPASVLAKKKLLL